MKKTFHIHGMSCQGCKTHVEKILMGVEGVKSVSVDLESEKATVDMDYDVGIKMLQHAFKEDGGAYQIHLPGEKPRMQLKQEAPGKGKGVFYCPMRCEGDKTYDKPGDCPVCGMDLVEEFSAAKKTSSEWTCPMHPEIVKKVPGDCPICGMEMVMKKPERSAEEIHSRELLRKLWIALLFTIPVFLIAMSEMIPGNSIYEILEQKYWNWIQFFLSLPVVFYSTWMFFVRAYRSVISRNPNMFTLIGIGSGVAWVFSVIGMVSPGLFPEQFKTDAGTVHVYFEAATVILTLVLLGQVLEAKAHSRTNSAIKELLKLAPNKALKILDGQEVVVGIDEIEVGDILKVKPGERIPVDGSLIEGRSAIDESMITGEPIPVAKKSGDSVKSGTINGNQVFTMRAEKVGSDTLLAQIIKMVSEASLSRAPIQNLADKVSAYFVPIVILVSAATFVVWAIWGPEPSYVYGMINAIAVLIIACPCALGLATPMSVMVGIGKGANKGVLFKNAEALQNLSNIDTLIVDKTGTITEGKPTVEQLEVFVNHISPDDILKDIVALNNNSEHPLAEATLKYGRERNIEVVQATDFTAVTGQGVKGVVDGRKVTLGNSKMMKSSGIDLTDEQLRIIHPFQQQGKTVSLVAVNEQLAGYLVISDRIRETSAEAIKNLMNKGIRVMMLTGDNPVTAKHIAEKLELDDFKAGMLPEDKLAEVKALQQEGSIVAMAGDGINDAPALAKSDIGIAMGTGTDVAIESGDITLVEGDLHGIDKAHNLSKAVMKNIKQNLFFAMIYNTIGVPIAAGVLYPVFGILLSPMIAALAMSFSSVSVIANALRLKNVKI